METLSETAYNCIDTLATSNNYKAMIEEDRNKRSFLFDQAILGPAMTMQLRGVRIDQAAVKLADEETKDAANDLQKEFIALASKKIKWGKGMKVSPKQLGELLYGEYKVRVRTSSTGAPTVNKEAIASILDDPKTPDEAFRLAEIAQELSVLEEDRKVLHKPLREDGRMHTTFVPAGTTSGRFCLPPEVEVLTRFGWVSLKDWDDEDKIVCWDPRRNILEFKLSKKLIFDNNEPLIQIKSGDREKFKLLCTPDHRIPAITNKNNFRVYLAKDKATLHKAIVSSILVSNFVPEIQTRIAVMVQADGCIKNRQTISFGFAKQRKIDRCIELLTAANLDFKVKKYTNGKIFIDVYNSPNWMTQSKCFGFWLLQHNPKIFIDEIKFWDGSIGKSDKHGFVYYSTDTEAVLWAQTMAHLAGFSAITREQFRYNQKWNKAYSVYITRRPYTRVTTKCYETSEVIPNKVYCAETVTGFFLIRCQGTISITGNSAKKDHFDFGCNLQALSHRLHKIFVPDDGYVFINIDQKQAESKGVAYLSGCEKYKQIHKDSNTHIAVGKLLFPELNYDKKQANETKLPWDHNHSYYDLFKRIQHASNYAQTPRGLARQIHSKINFAEELQNKYFANFSEIRDWQLDIAQKLKIYHSLTTPLGRSRLFLGRTWDDSLVKEAIAYIPQSMISQLNKIILWRIWNYFDPNRAQVLLEGHDSNLFQVKIGDTETVEEILEKSKLEIMIRGDIMSVELEAQWGYSWDKKDLQDWTGRL